MRFSPGQHSGLSDWIPRETSTGEMSEMRKMKSSNCWETYSEREKFDADRNRLFLYRPEIFSHIPEVFCYQQFIFQQSVTVAGSYITEVLLLFCFLLYYYIAI